MTKRGIPSRANRKMPFPGKEQRAGSMKRKQQQWLFAGLRAMNAPLVTCLKLFSYRLSGNHVFSCFSTPYFGSKTTQKKSEVHDCLNGSCFALLMMLLPNFFGRDID